ncbi:MAG: hypothetical protein A3B74_03460 [Candidatus Kerfeldbacteria bacterium RIFCSPHIGHO2_02_FULL_42_14]|uniref:Uncharacterized protein n=1 Tax=Candidatus Kerfeldbacteria bacterium RIFCSPHIGHO2_02_FULL_42_14 TaxID=1798540 RepID=A0A1G2AUW6_9BACT|nr:MAG: hypothetical protein A3B74_03460 [Candidatus Kerfeldbacteria bacterium RIFCSPHIGHO2_02_FULL_42_14]
MQISNKLPQFHQHKSLLVVTGYYEAEYFIAYQGFIEKVQAFKLEKPEYSDREGFFEQKAQGVAFGSPAIQERIKRKMKQDFFKQCKEMQKKFNDDHDLVHIYIFTPEPLSIDLKKTFSKKLQQKIVFTFGGNYYKEHPFELLKRIQKESKSS